MRVLVSVMMMSGQLMRGLAQPPLSDADLQKGNAKSWVVAPQGWDKMFV